MPRPFHTSCGGPRWRRSAGLRPTCTSRSQNLPQRGTASSCAEDHSAGRSCASRLGSFQGHQMTAFASGAATWQGRRSCWCSSQLNSLLRGQHSQDIQGDVRRDSGGAASHWSIPEPHGPAEARRDHQSSCGGAAERRQDIVQPPAKTMQTSLRTSPCGQNAGL